MAFRRAMAAGDMDSGDDRATGSDSARDRIHGRRCHCDIDGHWRDHRRADVPVRRAPDISRAFLARELSPVQFVRWTPNMYFTATSHTHLRR